MKSFRIPLSRMTLSEDGLDAALKVDSIHEAEAFLDTFGSHVSSGRQEVRYSITWALTFCETLCIPDM